MSWEIKNKIKQVLDKEEGTQIFTPGARRPLAFIYPNSYNIGMSNLGLQILYREINSRELIKVKILQNLDADKDEARELAEELSKKSGAELVGIIGKIMIFYKENKDKPVISQKLKSVK